MRAEGRARGAERSGAERRGEGEREEVKEAAMRGGGEKEGGGRIKSDLAVHVVAAAVARRP
jgi:hypothetical protein